MADELDIVTQETARPHNTGDDLNNNMAPSVDEETSNAIDALAGVTPKSEDDAAPKDEDEDAAPASDDADEDAASKDDEDAAPKDDEDAAPKEDDEGAAPKVEEGEDPFKDISLPPHTSTKASDSFNAVKEKAKAQIADRETKIKELSTELESFRTKAVVTPEEKAELEELRKVKYSMEIESSPEFKEKYDSRIAKNNDIIYSKFSEAGMTPEQITKIKEMGGPAKLKNWDDIYEYLSPSQRRVVDSRLTANEDLIDSRNSEVKKAKENVEGFVKQRQEEQTVLQQKETEEIERVSKEMISQVSWVNGVEIPKDANPEQVKALAAENQFIKSKVEEYNGFLKDRSPEMHAMLAFGTLQAFRYRRDLEASVSQLNQLKEENKQLSDKLAKIRKSSRGPADSAAPRAKVKPVNQFNANPEDALDALRAEVTR